jgi:hypothetical protein
VALLSPADMAEFRHLRADLAFADPYQVIRRHTVSTDDVGNPVTADVVVESGLGLLRNTGLTPTEGLRADTVAATVAMVVDLPIGTLAHEGDRIRIAGRTLEIAGIQQDGALSTAVTAYVQEWGR